MSHIPREETNTDDERPGVRTESQSATPAAATDQSMAELVRQHERPLLAYVERITRDHHAAHDIVQETFIRAWKHADVLRPEYGSVRGWLLTVARNLATDRLRSATVRRETVSTDIPDVASAGDHAETVASDDVVTRLLRGLSADHREVLVYTFVLGLTVQQTGALLGIPVGTVKSRRYYALRMLRQMRHSTGGAHLRDLTTAPSPKSAGAAGERARLSRTANATGHRPRDRRRTGRASPSRDCTPR